ncbi:cupin domain-containing protein [Sphingomonas sp.]|uniref:cupin domain-containing protein n=1 Tax=Sphingomonas sp. TaxID=28214 RepID=UPI00286E52C4|nr:cupin domain-containing protein [Sphingomonas sp.]
MPKIDLAAIEQTNRTGYPPPFNLPVAGRHQRRLAPATGLTDFGVSEVTLEPGAWSSQRHWHDGEDEFVVMLEGEAVLVENDGRVTLRAGDMAAWPKGSTNGHHLINESEAPCRFLAFGGGTNIGGGYSDIDMRFTPEGIYTHKDGTPYPPSL